MKKTALMIAALGASLAFSACQDSADDHPILNKTEGQTVNILNVPEASDVALQFTPDNKDGHLHMTCARPTEYGFSAPISYQVEVALNEDFTTPEIEGAPAAVVLSTAFQNNEQVNPPYTELAKAMREMLDIQTPDQVPTPYYKLYVRLIANVVTASGQPYEGTTLVSNIVSVDEVSVGFIDAVEAGKPSGIYVRGDMNGWNPVDNWEFLTTTTPGVYEIDECVIDAGQGFKVADANWGSVNYGLGTAPIVFNKPVELGKKGDNIKLSEKFSGRIQITLEGDKCQILFDADEPDVPGQATGVYIKGDFNGWQNDANAEFFTTDIKGRWTIANITITPGTFKVADANWGPINLGGNGEPIEPGVAYKLKDNGDNIKIAEEFVGTATIKIKDGDYYLTLTPSE